MRILIAAACIAVIAAVGYFFWGEYEAHRARVERAEDEAGAKAEIYEFAKARPYERDKAAAWCKQTEERLATDLKGNEMGRKVVQNCRHFDLLD